MLVHDLADLAERRGAYTPLDAVDIDHLLQFLARLGVFQRQILGTARPAP